MQINRDTTAQEVKDKMMCTFVQMCDKSAEPIYSANRLRAIALLQESRSNLIKLVELLEENKRILVKKPVQSEN